MMECCSSKVLQLYCSAVLRFFLLTAKLQHLGTATLVLSSTAALSYSST
jgi:hypothetical protein